ncbi:hypothetical protein [Galbibacter sp. PAP.153]|uniref:hypothetical protein n=1 Tax=Galbibacter sp. PAP.153 TaxID=3104623 RepID=UPI003009435F
MKDYFLLICVMVSFNLDAQDIISGGNNKWQFHTPDDGRQDMFIAPDLNGDWLWSSQTVFRENGDITISGNLGIGTGTLDAKLRIEGSKSLARFSTEEEGIFKIFSTRSDLNSEPANLVLGAQYNIILDPNMYGTSGNVGIGTMNPEAKLDVYGTLQILKNTQEQLAFSQVHRNGTDNRSLIAPRTIDNSGWDWANEFGFHNYNRNWYFDNNVSIGTTNANGWKLAVNGKIRAKEVKVETSWSDFVFENNYDLPTLEEVEKHIQEKGHLKDIPSAKEVEKNGIHLGEMNAKLLQKIEELVLYTIEANKVNARLNNRINELEKRIEELEN